MTLLMKQGEHEAEGIMDWQYRLALASASIGLTLLASGIPHELGAMNISGVISFISGGCAAIAGFYPMRVTVNSREG
jgi:hypothetical protein